VRTRRLGRARARASPEWILVSGPDAADRLADRSHARIGRTAERRERIVRAVARGLKTPIGALRPPGRKAVTPNILFETYLCAIHTACPAGVPLISAPKFFSERARFGGLPTPPPSINEL
jgi:hypothetical protein